MRRAATLANLVDNNLTFGTVPIKSIAEVIYNALGDEKDEEALSQAQGQFTNQLNEYNKGKDKKDQLTANQYNKKVNANFFDKGVEKVKEWGSSAWEGTKLLVVRLETAQAGLEVKSVMELVLLGKVLKARW